MPAVTGNGCFTKYCPTLASPVLLKQPLGASLSMRERCYLSKKKLSTLPTSYTSSFMSCKSQLSPILPTPTSKPEATQRHESLLKSLLLNQGMISYDDDDDHLSLRRSKSEELIEKFKKILRKPSGQRSKMKLIDAIQRLGIGHHFEEEISLVLEGVSDNYGSGENLLSTALCFRLLRHNGWPTSSDVFDKFLNKKRELKESLRHDMPGILSLYEASYLATKGEEKLLNAMEFTKSHLKQSLPSMSPHLQTHVAKALDLPRHLRMETLEARNYINKYSQESNHIPALLQLAKLEFDELQSLHKQELAEIIRWWKQLGLVDKLGFGRDRPLECFLWTVGIFPNASYSSVRIELTKTICILLIMDDIFDTYGSLDELVLFNDAIKRWELSAMEQLPEYMKICYMALYNTTNEIAYKVLKQHGWCIASHLKRTWIDIFEAFLTEAEWFNSGYTPTLEQYLTNGVTSGGSYMALVHSFFLIGHAVTDETVSMMQPYPEIFSCSGKILRLWDDLGTAKEEKERGDVASSIECYMRENNDESEEEARKHVRKLIGSLWLELNGHLITSSTPNANALPKSITKACFNLARTAQLIYQHGDDNTLFTVDDHIQSLFFRSC